MKVHNYFIKAFGALLVAALLFAALPTGAVQAQTGQNLYVSDWGTPATAFQPASGAPRPTIVYDGSLYHLWYGIGDNELYHTTSADPASFTAGTPTTYDETPFEVSSPTIVLEDGTFYMIAYKTGVNTVFSIYTSTNGEVWTYAGDVFNGTGLGVQGTAWRKFDAPVLLKDTDTYKLYFQVAPVTGDYKIFMAETGITTLSAIADANDDNDFTLANNNTAVLTIGASGSPDDVHVQHPMVVKDSGTYFMWYTGVASAAPNYWRSINFATSPDGINWTKSPANPIIKELNSHAEAMVLKVGDMWHLWHEYNEDFIQYVSASGPFEFKSIQGAIDAASDGDTINVYPGTYLEGPVQAARSAAGLYINKPNLTIRSTDGAANTIIDVQGESGTLYNGVEVDANLGTITIDGFTVQNFTQDGIKHDYTKKLGTIFNVLNNIIIPKADYLRNGIEITGDGSTAIGNIVYGMPLTPDWGSCGIQVDDASDAQVKNNEIIGGSLGVDYGICIGAWDFDIANVLIQGNTVSDAGDALGIMTGYTNRTVSNISVLNNEFNDSENGLTVRNDVVLSGLLNADENQFNNIINEVVYFESGVTVDTTFDFDASPNWWGSILGPDANDLTEFVTDFEFVNEDYAPWCGDAECSFLVYDTPQTDGFYLEDGKVALSGTINFTGGIPASEPGVTYLIKQGTTIQNDSPCFTVTADHVRIEGEYPGEEFCVPTADSAGIEVAAGVSDLVIKNLDISGASTTGPAINFAGDVNGVQIVNNKMHDFTASAIVFGGEVLTEHVIQGNMFMNVGSPAIVSPTTALVATYNSWGVNAAPTITNVTTTPFTHADVTANTSYDFFSGSQILAGETITYSVIANLTEISGAEFTLTYPTDLLTLSSTTDGTVFIGNGPGGLLLDTTIAGTIDFSGTIPLGGSPVTGTNLELFTATFTVADPIAAATLGTLDLIEIPQGFSMTPAGTSYTNHVYPALFTDAELTAIGDLPSIDAVGMEGYYLVDETREFVVSADNPASGGTFSNVLFRFELTADDGDIALFQYDDSGTWTNMPLDCTTTTGVCVGYFGPSGGFPIGPDYTADTTFQAEFAVEGDYPVEVTLVDLNDAEKVLATYTNTAVVYTVPTIASTDIEGPYQAEFAQGFGLTVTVDPDMIGEIAFELLFDFPAGTVVTYGGTDYTCTIAGCPLIPVTLVGGANTLPFTVTFPAGYDGPINVTLLDAAWDPDRTLASQDFDVLVYGNFAVDGKVTMQGRTYRGDVPMTLTGLDLLGYGPYLGTSLDQLGQNIFFTDVAEGYYVVTTNQARYLNVPGAMLVVSKTMSMPDLYLYGGNANTDHIVDLSDASLVGGAYGTGDLTSLGDVNFDNQVNIQDLALVGGNYLLTDAVYDDWMIPYGMQGQVLTDESGQVTGTLTGPYNITIEGQVSEYVNNQATFSGTVGGDIIGTVTATINENGTGTMYGTLIEDGTLEEFQILGIFPKSGVGGHFVGTIVQDHVPSVTALTITSEGDATTVAEGATLQMYANVIPVDAYDRVIWSVWTNPDNPDRGEATIDPITGLLTGVSDGPVTVIAKALDGSLLDDTFSVTVTAP